MAHLTQQPCKPISPPARRRWNAPPRPVCLPKSPGWSLNGTGGEISRTFRFKNYYETMAFVNALAWIAHREDHHPDIEVGYNRCHVRFSTHSVKGLSQNDFICAAKLNVLFGNSVTAPGVTLPPTSL